MTLIALNCQIKIKKKSSLDSTSVLYSQPWIEVGKESGTLSGSGEETWTSQEHCPCESSTTIAAEE